MPRHMFTIAILCSAAPLFLVQPLAGKIFLPVLGNSPAVWNTCLVFFQTALLAGYGYADVLPRRLPLAAQVAVHAAVLAAAAAEMRPYDLPWVVLDHAPVTARSDWQPRKSPTDIFAEIAVGPTFSSPGEPRRC